MSDETLRQLVDQLPDRPPRGSKLEPFADVVFALRKKRWTYREIAAFLKDHEQLAVTHTTVFDFVKARSRRIRSHVETSGEASSLVAPPPHQSLPSLASVDQHPESASPRPRLSPEEVARRRDLLQSIRNKPALEPKPPVLEEFRYDPDKPLTIDRSIKD